MNKNASDNTGNLNTATESVCPKGWTLPSVKQIDNNRSISEFSPVLGGGYYNGTLYNEDTRGYWWGSTAYNGARRYGLYYYGSSLDTNSDYRRRDGYYVRCVSEEKTMTDLTYLQDMTGEIADNTLLDGYRELTTYDLVTYGPSGKECYGSYSSVNKTSWGPGFENACIHSGTIAVSGDLPSNWYNYVLASAGTIIDKDTSSSNPATNTAKATESICPKGWTLPDRIQSLSIGNSTSAYIASFSPVLGGNYRNSSLYYETTVGYWWSTDAFNSLARYIVSYENGKLHTRDYGRRYDGLYIRCVQAP